MYLDEHIWPFPSGEETYGTCSFLHVMSTSIILVQIVEEAPIL